MAQVDDVGETLLRAASDLLATEGPAALTVRRIAHEAGVSTMNVYSRFGSKDGVVDRLYIDGFTRLRNAVSAQSLDDPMEDLRACGQAYRRFARDNPTYYAVMFEGVVPDFRPSPEAKDRAQETLGLLAERLARAMEHGVIARADPLHTAAAVWATCHGVVSLEMNGVGPEVIEWAAVYDIASAAVLAGLARLAIGPTARTAGATTT